MRVLDLSVLRKRELSFAREFRSNENSDLVFRSRFQNSAGSDVFHVDFVAQKHVNYVFSSHFALTVVDIHALVSVNALARCSEKLAEKRVSLVHHHVVLHEHHDVVRVVTPRHQSLVHVRCHRLFIVVLPTFASRNQNCEFVSQSKTQ